MIHLDTNALIALLLWAQAGHPVIERIAAAIRARASLLKLNRQDFGPFGLQLMAP